MPITALPPAKVAEIHGPALNALVAKMLKENETVDAMSSRELRNHKRCLRKAALKAPLSEDFQQRRREISTRLWRRCLKTTTALKRCQDRRSKPISAACVKRHSKRSCQKVFSNSDGR